MVGVTLEEFLKTLLKNKFIVENRDKSVEPSLDWMEKSGLSAESNFGSFKLHNAIEKCFKEKLITDEEKMQLMAIKENIRNAFVHSDKSKIFDSSTKGNVDLLKFKNNKIIREESKDMSALALFVVHGIQQKHIANKEAKNIFNKVDALILKINNRFWDTTNSNKAT